MSSHHHQRDDCNEVEVDEVNNADVGGRERMSNNSGGGSSLPPRRINNNDTTILIGENPPSFTLSKHQNNRRRRKRNSITNTDHSNIKMIIPKGYKIRDEFTCPITRELISDPVIAADGHTYDRLAIEQWLHHSTSSCTKTKQRTTSPKTGQPLSHYHLIPNHNLKRLLHDFIFKREERHALYCSGGEKEGSVGIMQELRLKFTGLGPPESEWFGKTFFFSESFLNGRLLGGRRKPAEETLGGGEKNDECRFVQFSDATVSRQHFEIRYLPPASSSTTAPIYNFAGRISTENDQKKRFIIRDVGSAGGTFLRLPPKQGVVLREGMMLMIGKHQLVAIEPDCVEKKEGGVRQNWRESGNRGVQSPSISPQRRLLETRDVRPNTCNTVLPADYRVWCGEEQQQQTDTTPNTLNNEIQTNVNREKTSNDVGVGMDRLSQQLCHVIIDDDYDEREKMAVDEAIVEQKDDDVANCNKQANVTNAVTDEKENHTQQQEEDEVQPTIQHTMINQRFEILANDDYIHEDEKSHLCVHLAQPQQHHEQTPTPLGENHQLNLDSFSVENDQNSQNLESNLSSQSASNIDTSSSLLLSQEDDDLPERNEHVTPTSTSRNNTVLNSSSSQTHDLETEQEKDDPLLVLRCFAPEGTPIQNKEFLVTKMGATLGRKQSNTISFSHRVVHDNTDNVDVSPNHVGIDSSISGEHAHITYNGYNLHLYDGSSKKGSSGSNSSTNGTWIRLSPMHKASNWYVLEDKTEVLVGTVRFQVSVEDILVERDL